MRWFENLGFVFMFCFICMLDPHGLISIISFFYIREYEANYVYVHRHILWCHNIRRHHFMLSYMVTYCTFFLLITCINIILISLCTWIHSTHHVMIIRYVDSYHTSYYAYHIHWNHVMLVHMDVCRLWSWNTWTSSYAYIYRYTSYYAYVYLLHRHHIMFYMYMHTHHVVPLYILTCHIMPMYMLECHIMLMYILTHHIMFICMFIYVN